MVNYVAGQMVSRLYVESLLCKKGYKRNLENVVRNKGSKTRFEPYSN
jgi:hypothetical protein